MRKILPSFLAEKLKPEAEFYPRTTSLVELFYVTGRMFLLEIFGNARFLQIFAHFLNIFGQNEWHIVFLSQFYISFRKVILTTGYPFNYLEALYFPYPVMRAHRSFTIIRNARYGPVTGDPVGPIRTHEVSLPYDKSNYNNNKIKIINI